MIAPCTSRSSAGLRCDRTAHPGDRRHFNELSGVEWFESVRTVSRDVQIRELEELHGWRGQGELNLGGAGDVQAHAMPTRARR